LFGVTHTIYQNGAAVLVAASLIATTTSQKMDTAVFVIKLRAFARSNYFCKRLLHPCSPCSSWFAC